MDNESSWLIATNKTHKIVCKDDGFLSLVVTDAFDSVVRVDYSTGLTITKERELMVSIASGLTKDISPESFGPVVTDYRRTWALIPGALLLAFGGILGTPFAGLTQYLLPVLLIVLGGYLIVRFFRPSAT